MGNIHAARRIKQKAKSKHKMEVTAQGPHINNGAVPPKAKNVTPKTKPEDTASETEQRAEAAGAKVGETVAHIGKTAGRVTIMALVTPVVAISFGAEIIGFCAGSGRAGFLRGMVTGAQKYNDIRDGKGL